MSLDTGRNLIDRTILRIAKQAPAFFKHHKILDLGVGTGAQSDRYSKTYLSRKKFHWKGIEIWDPYIKKYNLNDKYDTLFVADAVEYCRLASSDYFDITFINIIEHVAKERAIQLVNDALRISQVVIFNVAILPHHHGPVDGNPHEAHVKEDWSHAEVMSSFSNIIFWGIEDDIGVYVCCLPTSYRNGSACMEIEHVLKPQIGVYAICKNEIEFLERCYSSIVEADFIVFCDTGSTDGTWEKLVTWTDGCWVDGKSSTIKYNNSEGCWNVTNGIFSAYKISVQPWRWDDARNVALGLLPEEIDICISIDADELMEPGWKKALDGEILNDLQNKGRVCDRYNHRFSTIWNWKDVEANGAKPSFSDHWHERIHSRKGFRWKLPVHEVLVKGDGQTPEDVKWLGGVKMIQKPDTSKSRAYYTPMIKKAIEEDPTRWKLYSFLASDLIGAGQISEAIKQLRIARDLPDADKGFVSLQLSRALCSDGKYDEGINELATAVVLSPGVREYKVYLARLYLERGKKAEALCFYELAAAQTVRTNGYQFDSGCWDEAFEEELKKVRAS